MHDDPNNESNVKEYIIAEDEFSWEDSSMILWF